MVFENYNIETGILGVGKNTYYNISSVISERVTLFKLWLSIMVVYIHSYSTEIHFNSGDIVFIVPVWLENIKYIISQSISSCAVPAFFVLSAIFLYRKDFSWWGNIKKKYKSLFIPYFLLNTLWILIFAVVQNIPSLSNFFSNPNNIVANWGINEWLKAYGFLSPELTPQLYPLWFIRNLIILNVFAVVIKKLLDYMPRVSLLVIVLLWIIPTSFMDGYTKQSICFWVLGYFMVHYNIAMDTLDNKKIWLTLIYLVLLIADCWLRYSILHSFSILVGIAFWFTCATLISGKAKEILLWIASFNFAIYLFHEMTLTTLKKIIVKILPTTAYIQLLEYICIPLLVICICLLFSFLMKKYCISLYSVITGNRTR